MTQLKKKKCVRFFPPLGLFLVLVLQSASVERFSVFRMRDFLLKLAQHFETKIDADACKEKNVACRRTTQNLTQGSDNVVITLPNAEGRVEKYLLCLKSLIKCMKLILSGLIRNLLVQISKFLYKWVLLGWYQLIQYGP